MPGLIGPPDTPLPGGAPLPLPRPPPLAIPDAARPFAGALVDRVRGATPGLFAAGPPPRE